MIRVGMILSVSKQWMGGLNYFKNLLYALSTLPEKQIEVVVFTGTSTDEKSKSVFRKHAELVEDSIFDRKSIRCFFWRLSNKIFHSSVILDRLLKKHRIHVLSHSGIAGLNGCKTVNWIPDFQHIHLPHMFAEKEIDGRNRHFSALAGNSDVILLSSYDAYDDYCSSGFPKGKARVLRFVSQVENSQHASSSEEDIKKKYRIDGPFFYLPNQFWKHKNHHTAFEAIRLLKQQGVEMQLVCSGYMSDYRHEAHTTFLEEFIRKNSLSTNILLLGLIPYEDLFSLMRESLAVLNPSLFEGWSSTVEECKSMGKNMILSDINVHKEQYPDALFFRRLDPQDLAEKMLSFKGKSFTPLNPDAASALKKRTLEFAQQYQDIILSLVPTKGQETTIIQCEEPKK